MGCQLTKGKFMLARELRDIANKIHTKELKTQTSTAVEYLETLTLVEAEKGKFNLKIDIDILPFNKDILINTFISLNGKGYTCSIKNEITNWYSNSDCDSADYLIINW